jgi:hypothetical protein
VPDEIKAPDSLQAEGILKLPTPPFTQSEYLRIVGPRTDIATPAEPLGMQPGPAEELLRHAQAAIVQTNSRGRYALYVFLKVMLIIRDFTGLGQADAGSSSGT